MGFASFSRAGSGARRALVSASLLAFAAFGAGGVQAAVTVEPITWNVIGLDSNKPNTVQPNPGVYPPDTFPVGIRVCTDSATDLESTSVLDTDKWYTEFHWGDSNDAFIYLTDSANATVDPLDGPAPGDRAGTEFIYQDESLAAGQCRDVFYQVSVYRVAGAYDQTRDYWIEVKNKDDVVVASSYNASNPPPAGEADSGSDSGKRELYVEHLVSQNRNAIDAYYVNGTEYTPGGAGVTIYDGQTFELKILAHTATQGYEQLETFMTLPPDLFRINSVSATYSAAAGTDPDAGTQLYADGCNWIDDPDDSRYHTNESCASVGKYGGTITKTYNITVIGNPGSDDLNGPDVGCNPAGTCAGSYSGQTMIYDFSGSSYHYNADYESGALYFTWGANATPYDVSVTKTAVDNGGSGNGTYTITVDVQSLDGGAPITGGNPINESIIVGDYLPDGYNIKSAPSVGGNVSVSVGSLRFCDTKGGTCVAPASATLTDRYVEWTIPANTFSTANLSESMDITFDDITGFTSTDPADYTNCARIDAAATDNNSSNNESCVFFSFATPIAADLSVQKTVKSYDPGTGKVRFQLVVTNENGGLLSGSVYVRDTLPAGYDYVLGQTVALTGNVSTVSVPTSNVDTEILSFTFNDVVANEVAGASATIEFDAFVSIPTVGTTAEALAQDYTNAVGLLEEIAPVTPLTDADVTNNAASAAYIPPLLEIEKSTDGTLSGSTYDYTLTVTKVGTFADNDNITVYEAPPAGSTITAMSGTNWSCTLATDTDLAQCERSVVNATDPTPYEVIDVTATFSPMPTTTVTLINTAYVEARDGGPGGDVIDNTYDDDIATISYTVNADLSLTKQLKAGSSATPNVGDSVTFQVTVSNAGPSAATGVEVADQLPNGYTYTSHVEGQGTYVPGTGIWTVGNIASGSSATLEITATVNAPGAGVDYTNVAEVSNSDQTDPDSTPNNDDGDQSEDDEDSAAVTPQQADLSLSKQLKAGSSATPNVGDSVTFSVVVSNSGSSTATNVEVVDQLPNGYAYQSHLAGQGTYVSGAGVWTVGDIVNAASATLEITATVNAPGAGVDYKNVAEVTASDQFDPDSAPDNDDGDQSEDDEDFAAVAPQQADLSLVKTVSNSTPFVGDEVTFTLTLSNAGPDTATSVDVTDVLPNGYSYSAFSMTGGDVRDEGAAPTLVWTVNSLASGADAVLTFKATVNASGTYANTAEVTASDQYDPDSTAANDDGDQSEDDESSVSVVTPNIYDPPYGIKVGTLESGNTVIRWTMVWQNGSGFAVPDVLITDDTSAYPGWSYIPASLTCKGNGATTVNGVNTVQTGGDCSIVGDEIQVTADFGADEDVDTLEISFLASIDDPNQGAYENQATSSCPSCGGATRRSDNNAKSEVDPTFVRISKAVPTLSEWMLYLLSALVAAMGLYAVSRRQAV